MLTTKRSPWARPLWQWRPLKLSCQVAGEESEQGAPFWPKTSEAKLKQHKHTASNQIWKSVVPKQIINYKISIKIYIL